MIWENLINSIKDRFNGLSAEQQRLFVIICTVFFSVILTIAVIISMRTNNLKNRKPEEAVHLQINIPISPDELFLPDEPDFLPGVLLDRERRDVWTEDDAMEFWQDPLRAGEEQWRDKMDTAIDVILEGIP